MLCRALVAVLFAVAAPAIGWCQDITWKLPDGRSFEIEVIRAQGRDNPNLGNPSTDIFFQGATFFRFRTPDYRSAHLVVEMPAAYLIGRVPSCVDAYCTSFERAFVFGNPSLGLSYKVPSLSLVTAITYRFPMMDLQPWEEGADDNWDRGIDQMAADAALLAVGENTEEAVTPRTSSFSANVTGEIDLPGGAWSQLKAGVARVRQQANEAYHRRYDQSSRTDVHYDLRFGYDAGNWRSGVGLSGRSTVARSPSHNCEAVFGTQCDNLAQFDMMGSYALGRWTPTVLARLPMTEYLKRRTRWSLALGLAVGY